MPKFAVIQIKEKPSDRFNCLIFMLILNIKKACHLFAAIQFAAATTVKTSFLLKKTLLWLENGVITTVISRFLLFKVCLILLSKTKIFYKLSL